MDNPTQHQDLIGTLTTMLAWLGAELARAIVRRKNAERSLTDESGQCRVTALERKGALNRRDLADHERRIVALEDEAKEAMRDLAEIKGRLDR